MVAANADGSAEMLAWLVEKRPIEPHVPVSTNRPVLTVRFRAGTLATIGNATSTFGLLAKCWLPPALAGSTSSPFGPTLT
jgi:hypothetical protein